MFSKIVCGCFSVSVFECIHAYYVNACLCAVGPQRSAGPCCSLTLTEHRERSECPLLSASFLSLTQYDQNGFNMLTMTGGQQVIHRSITSN